jgi:cysteine desulfurase
MVYFDYSATTPIDDAVIEEWIFTEKHIFANANSSHALGKRAFEYNQENLNKIASYLHVLPQEIILTSSATEANNLAIKGCALKHTNKKHIAEYHGNYHKCSYRNILQHFLLL